MYSDLIRQDFLNITESDIHIFCITCTYHFVCFWTIPGCSLLIKQLLYHGLSDIGKVRITSKHWTNLVAAITFIPVDTAVDVCGKNYTALKIVVLCRFFNKSLLKIINISPWSSLIITLINTFSQSQSCTDNVKGTFDMRKLY